MARTDRVRRAAVLAAVCGLMGWVGAAQGAEPAAPRASLAVQRVALFKNGLGFVSATVTLPDNAKTVTLGQLPAPAYGTFWVAYPADLKVRGLVTSMEEVQEPAPVRDLGQLLQLNAGRRVTLRLGTAGQEAVTGVVLRNVEPAEAAAPDPYIMSARMPRDPYGRYTPVPSSGNVLLFKTEKGVLALNPGSIVRAEFEDEKNVLNAATITLKRPSIRLDLDQPAGGQKVSVSFLAHGLTWAPGYFIDLSDPKTAKFSARALVVNELTDFSGVQLDLVTGFPNIKFGDVTSPIAMGQSLADFLNALAGAGTEGNRRGQMGGQYMMAQQAVMSNTAAFEEFAAPPTPGYSTAAEGTVSEDLFLYPVKDFTLKKGETAWVPLFTAQMSYRHVYTWKIDDTLDRDDRYRPQGERADAKAAEEVWHSCRLVNSLAMPLTTATAEFVKDGQFTGQDVCYYTAPGAETTIRINRAMNVLAEQAEFEVERKRNAATFYGYQYDLVKVRGDLRLSNRLDKPVTVEVTKELSGEVLQTSSKGKDVTTAKGLKQVNPRHILTWEVDVQPNEKENLSYTYQVYIRN